MIQANEQAIRQVVQEVLAQLGRGAGTPNAGNGSHRSGDWGVFRTVDDAVAAATDGFEKLRDASLADRAKAIACVYRICDEQADELGRLELEETKIGRLDHKIEKLQIVKLVPGHRIPQVRRHERRPRADGDRVRPIRRDRRDHARSRIRCRRLAGNVREHGFLGQHGRLQPASVGGADRLRGRAPLQSGNLRGDGTGEPDHDRRRADARNGRPDLRTSRHPAAGRDGRTGRCAGRTGEQKAGDRRRPGQSAGRRR